MTRIPSVLSPPIVGQQGTQFLIDGIARSKDAGTNGADGAIHFFSDFLVTQTVDFAERNSRLQVFRQ